MLTQKKAVNRH